MPLKGYKCCSPARQPQQCKMHKDAQGTWHGLMTSDVSPQVVKKLTRGNLWGIRALSDWHPSLPALQFIRVHLAVVKELLLALRQVLESIGLHTPSREMRSWCEGGILDCAAQLLVMICSIWTSFVPSGNSAAYCLVREFWMLKAAGSFARPSLHSLQRPSSSTKRCTKEHLRWNTGTFIASLWTLFTNQTRLSFSMVNVAALASSCSMPLRERLPPWSPFVVYLYLFMVGSFEELELLWYSH